ncbi:MAG: glycosyltransferase family 4 protein [Patescibacteria group bacterium]
MKIVFFATYYYPYISGITTYPKKILDHLAKKNEVTVLTFKHSAHLPDSEFVDGVEVIRMPYNLRVSKGFISFQSINYFWKYAQYADRILLNFPNAEGLVLAVLAKFFKKKLFGIFHCRVFLDKSIFLRLAALVINTSVWLQMIFTDKIIIYTWDYFLSMKWESFFKNKAVQCLPPVESLKINTTYFRELSKKKENKKWVGFAGRIAQEKGLEYLIKAVSNLNDKNVELVFAGPSSMEVIGEDRYHSKIINLIKNAGIKVHFLGTLNGGKLGAFYRVIDLLALTSINQTEAFGMVQVESILSGTPVVASDLPGVKQPIELLQMGRLVKPRSIDEIVNAIQEILKNKHRFVAQDKFRENSKDFDPQKVFKFYEKVLNE